MTGCTGSGSDSNTTNDSGSTLPVISVSDTTIVEGDAGSTNANFTVTLSGTSTGSVTVSYLTVNESATAGEDYTAANGTLDFNSGPSQIISVPVLGDTTVEVDETFALQLSNPVNATLGASKGTATIQNDDVQPSLPVVSISDLTITEGDSGTQDVYFIATLSEAASGILTVDYVTNDGTAISGEDYIATSGSLTFNPGETEKQVTVTILGDINQEPTETFTVDLSNVSTNASLGSATATGTITNDDILIINDTGVTDCSDNVANKLSCPQADYPRQDAEYGWDSTQNDDADGHAGFSFTKIDAAGNDLPANAAAWNCVKDNRTGLTWEKKTDLGSGNEDLYDGNFNFTWYNSDPDTNGGDLGVADPQNALVYCGNGLVPGGCDTEHFVQAVNAAALCGYTDWRLPNAVELLSILDFSKTPGTGMMDTNYLPIFQPSGVAQGWWTATTAGTNAASAYVIYQSNAYVFEDPKTRYNHVRLVRGN